VDRVSFEQIIQVAQIGLLIMNALLVPAAFSGVRWVISVERRLAQIQTLLKSES
jgi:hypothetical protein